MSKTYVIGHVNPDTDSIASAMGYAWLLRQRDGMDAVAARAGALNPQSAWVLKQLGLEAPILLTDASPRFESVMQRLDSIRPEAQLGMAWTLASRTGGIPRWWTKMASRTALSTALVSSSTSRRSWDHSREIRRFAR